MSVFPPTPGSGLLSPSLSSPGQAPPKPHNAAHCGPGGATRQRGETENTSCQIPRGPFSGTGDLILRAGTVQNYLNTSQSNQHLDSLNRTKSDKTLFYSKKLDIFLEISFHSFVHRCRSHKMVLAPLWEETQARDTRQ